MSSSSSYFPATPPSATARPYGPLRDAANTTPSSNPSPYHADKKVWGGNYQTKILERTSSANGGLASRLSQSGSSTPVGFPRSGSRALPTPPTAPASSGGLARGHRPTSSFSGGGATPGAAGVEGIMGRFNLSRTDSFSRPSQSGTPPPGSSRFSHSPALKSPDAAVVTASSLMRSSASHAGNLHLDPSTIHELQHSSVKDVRGLASLERGHSYRGKSHHRSQTMPDAGRLGEDAKTLGHGTRLDRVSEASSATSGQGEDFDIPGITSGQVEDVVGMHGRIRLSRNDGGGYGVGMAHHQPSHSFSGSATAGLGLGFGHGGIERGLGSRRDRDRTRTKSASLGGRNLLPSQTLKALETQRHLLQAYEYLCHVGEAKQWLETVLAMSSDSIHDAPGPASSVLPPHPYSPTYSSLSSPTLSSPSLSPNPNSSGLESLSVVTLEQELRNGIVLARLARKFMGEREVPRIYVNREGRHFRHSDNINYFFKFVRWVGLPELFIFELVDLYDAKNLPKVIYCIHVLSHLLAKRGLAERIGNLVGKLEFSDGDLERTNAGLAGKAMPNFGNINRELAKEINEEPEPEPEPEETEEERRDRELAQLVPEVVALQSQVRGHLARLRHDTLVYRLSLASRPTVAIQSHARGLLARRRCAAALSLRRDLTAWVVPLQARARGVLARAAIVERLQTAQRYDACWTGLQAHVRGVLVRRRQLEKERQLFRLERGFIGLQSLVRAKLARQALQETRKELGSTRTAASVTKAQAQIRGLLARRRFYAPIAALGDHEDGIMGLQAHLRGALARRRLLATLQHLDESTPVFEAFQARCRGVLARRRLRDDVVALQEADDVTTLFQARARGALARREHARKTQMLKRVEVQRAVGGLQAFGRAALARRKVTEQKKELDFVQPDVTKVQAQIRGWLVRSDWIAWRDHVRNGGPTALYLQAMIRGFLFRRQFYERLMHYHDNVEKVVKVQSVFRARQQAEQYRQLIHARNVPMSVVKTFAHLLSDSDVDYQEEIEIERMRKEVVRSIRENQNLDVEVQELDTDIALLVKNKITLDEIQRTQKGHGAAGLAPEKRNSVLAAANDAFATGALDKATQRKLELYQLFFYLLQTRPEYLARLFFLMGKSEMTDKAKKVVEGVVLTLFGYAQNRREEFLLLKLFQRSIHEELAGVSMLSEFAKGNFTFIKLVVQYGRGAKERQYLRELLSPVVGDIVKQDSLTLETDPIKIYGTVLNAEENRTGIMSQRARDVTFNEALNDNETREIFIRHLQALRALTDRFVWAITQSTRRMPFGMRYIARELYRGLHVKFPDEPEEALAKVVLHMIYYRFIQPAVVAPETFDVVDAVVTPTSRKNLAEASKMLNQISAGRLFSDECPYLMPLNEYIQHASDTFTRWFYSLIDVEDAETFFTMDEFLDHTQSVKPTIFISPNEIYSTHSLILRKLDRVAPGAEDPLRLLLVELGGAPTAASAELDQARAGEIALVLENRFAVRPDPDADAKALWVRTKRYVLAMLKVQPGRNLLDAFLAPVTEAHESEWSEIVMREMAEAESGSTRRAAMQSPATSLEDVHSLSFQELKARTLENVLALEKLGRLSRNDGYQGMLDSLANDIIQRNRRRIQRQGDLTGLSTTLKSLQDKHAYLAEQLAHYENYISESMASLQKKGVKKGFVMPLTSQWKHQRMLEKRGKKPAFGSYKYSAQKLYEGGILLSIDQFSPRQFDRVSIAITCEVVGLYEIEVTSMGVPVPGGKAVFNIKDLLAARFAGRQTIALDVAKFNLHALVDLINRKFYSDREG